jgi:hypothetical protein
MWATYKIDVDKTTGPVAGGWQGGSYSGRLGPIPYAFSHYQGGTITVTVFARDGKGKVGSATVAVGLDPCKLR